MPQFGLTDTGFKRKPQNQILADKQADLRSIFGDEIDVSPQSPDGQMIERATIAEDLLWQLAEDIYNATDPDRNTGIAQSAAVKLNAITRIVARATRVTCEVVGTAGVTVPTGQSVGNGADITATTLTAFTFGTGGTATVEVDLTTTGPTVVAPGVINTINTPVTGWDSITNAAAGATGRNRETDAELRLRRNSSVAASSQNQVESIEGGVADVEGVTHVEILENRLGATDGDGVPGHSLEVIVQGGSDNDIAQAIWDNQPDAIGITGASSGTAIDSAGVSQTVNFTRTADLAIFVAIQLDKRADYPADGDDRIKQAIVDYANGVLTTGRSFAPGEDVILTELYTPINTVDGHSITSVFIGTSANPTGTINIPVGVRQASQFTVANIEIT